VIKIDNLDQLPKYVGDDTHGIKEMKVFADGSLILADPYLTKIRSRDDLEPAATTDPKLGAIRIQKAPTAQEYEDLIFAWYVNIHVRSNGVVIAKNGTTLAVGTGQQDRVGAVAQAIEKFKEKYKGKEEMKGAVMASDGFFPFRDSIDLIAEAGITAVVQPGGSVADHGVIQACNEHGISMVFTGERCFSHH
jgi:phosphoribosylaminoimidazolecarboxamide formyltransferase/IMP cyclohydrolase